MTRCTLLDKRWASIRGGVRRHTTEADKAMVAGFTEHRLDKTEGSVPDKVSSGNFQAPVFPAAMKAIGREQVNLADVLPV
jgi:hypothetical protein